MKLLTAALLAMLALTTGFTCNKNNPPEPQTEMAPPPSQEEMGAPADGNPVPDEDTDDGTSTQ
jgi:hypothetical protein